MVLLIRVVLYFFSCFGDCIVCLLKLVCPVWGVVFSRSPRYAFLGCLKDAFVEFLHYVVDISSLYLNVVSQFICPDGKESPFGLLVVPSWLRSVPCFCFSPDCEDDGAVVTSPELILNCSLDPLVDVISAESQVRGGGGLPAARVECRRVGGVVDED